MKNISSELITICTICTVITVVYSLAADLSSSKIPYITGGRLKIRLNFVQFHLHWESDSSKGSEHQISWKRYPLILIRMLHQTKPSSLFCDAFQLLCSYPAHGSLQHQLPVFHQSLCWLCRWLGRLGIFIQLRF